MKSTSFSRTCNMTDAEKQAFLMFAGTMHGFAKQTDQMIMGQSVNLRPISNDIQNTFAQVLQAPVQQNEPFQHVPQEQPLVYQQPEPQPQLISEPTVGVEQAIRELELVQQTSVPTPISTPISAPTPTPVPVSSDIVDILKEINLNLARIATTLESHGGQKRTKNTKTA